jgi:hypothetical protein
MASRPKDVDPWKNIQKYGDFLDALVGQRMSICAAGEELILSHLLHHWRWCRRFEDGQICAD